MFASGCGGVVGLSNHTGNIVVTAPAAECWSGSIGEATRQGCGPQTFSISGDILVAVVQKTSAGSWPLEVAVVDGSSTKDDQVTSAEYGLVSVSDGPH
jgi:hypothetical protein